MAKNKTESKSSTAPSVALTQILGLQCQDINNLNLQIKTLNNNLNDANNQINEYKANVTANQAKISKLNETIQRIKNEHKQATESLKRTHIGALLEKDVSYEEQLKELRGKLDEAEKPKISNAFFTDAKSREKRANQAIESLKKEMIPHGKSNRDEAIKNIVALLKEGLEKTDPQTYFNNKKNDLRRHVRKLNNWKSIAVTAVNAILTVLAVCSVVGITALWLTGTLDNNLSNRGSIFAFTAADKQKANRALYEVEQSLGCKIGG